MATLTAQVSLACVSTAEYNQSVAYCQAQGYPTSAGVSNYTTDSSNNTISFELTLPFTPPPSS